MSDSKIQPTQPAFSALDNPMAPQLAFRALNQPVDAHLEQLSRGVRSRPDLRDGEQSFELALPKADWRDGLPASPDVGGAAKARAIDLPKSSLDAAAASEMPPSVLMVANLPPMDLPPPPARDIGALDAGSDTARTMSVEPAAAFTGASEYNMVPTPLEAGIEILSGMYDQAPPAPMAPAYAGIPTPLEASIEILCGMIDPPPDPASIAPQTTITQYAPISYPPEPSPELSPVIAVESGAGGVVRGKA